MFIHPDIHEEARHSEFVNELISVTDEDKARKRELMRIYLSNKLDVDYPEYNMTKPDEEEDGKKNSCRSFIKSLNFSNWKDDDKNNQINNHHEEESMQHKVNEPDSPESDAAN
jgi:hypothetical protein